MDVRGSYQTSVIAQIFDSFLSICSLVDLPHVFLSAVASPRCFADYVGGRVWSCVWQHCGMIGVCYFVHMRARTPQPTHTRAR